MDGCLTDVSLSVKLYPNLAFEEVGVLYVSKTEAGEKFRKKYDAAKVLFIKQKANRAEKNVFENSCDVRRTTAYGALECIEFKGCRFKSLSQC